MKPLGQITTALLLPFLLSTPATSKSTTTDVDLDTRRSNTGPLTTTFTPAPTCLSERQTRYPWPGAYPDLEIGCQGPGGGGDCCPPGWGEYRYFSPGVCPSGYQACTLPTTRQREETTNLCCPSNYDCPTRVDYAMCRSSLNTWITADYTDRSGSSSIATFLAVSATPIQIRFRATEDSSVVPIPTGSFRLPPPPTEEELERERKAREDGGLSTGAKAGIGVGAVVGAIAIGVAACWFVKRRKHRRGATDGASSEPMIVPSNETADERVDEAQTPPPYSKH